MKILLQQSFSEDTLHTLIDSTIDTERDAINAIDAIRAFDAMVLACGVFDDSDHMYLVLNGESLGYCQITTEEDLIEFLGGD